MTLVTLPLCSCATFLSVGQNSLDIGSKEQTQDGVVINMQASYDVTFKAQEVEIGDGYTVEFDSKGTGKLDGVSASRVETLSVCRMPFASGTLLVKLLPNQTLQEVGITSQTGATRAISAAQSGVDATNTIEGLKKGASSGSGAGSPSSSGSK